jgi:epoxyqueuosine reductase
MTFNQLGLWARELGFSSVGIANTDFSASPANSSNASDSVGSVATGLQQWLAAGFHGTMDYMARGAAARLDPALLVPQAQRAIMVTMNYTPNDATWLDQAWTNLHEDERAYVARYALGRDYHKIVRSRLQKLMTQVEQALNQEQTEKSTQELTQECGQPNHLQYRVFCDSAPVMEVELATRAGLGWRGKHTLMLSREQGSMFFIGSILTNYPFDVTPPTSNHCGTCSQCIDVCPTQAIVAPHQLDARRCISYLTIEHKGAIDPDLRPLMGNRIYGCDDCQLICPWNKFAQKPSIPDFAARHTLDAVGLSQLFAWTAAEFNTRMEGSAIRRIGHERWLRNIAVALGNCKTQDANSVLLVLATRLSDNSAMVVEHVRWAMAQQQARMTSANHATEQVSL